VSTVKLEIFALDDLMAIMREVRANPGNQALGLANKLQTLGKTYELHVYAEDDHSLSIHHLDRDQKVVLWFKRYMK
jgi:dipeptidyl aminopeptidase/acylaminoacyl peptidase